MPFNAEFFYKASKPYKVASVQSDFEAVQKVLNNAFKRIQERTPHFNPKDVEVYLHGSYANNTNTYFPSHLEVMVELKKTGEYDSSKGVNNNYVLYVFCRADFDEFVTLGDFFAKFLLQGIF